MFSSNKFFLKNIKKINSHVFNVIINDCEDGKEYFFKNEKLVKLYYLTCKYLNLPTSKDTVSEDTVVSKDTVLGEEDRLTEDDKKYLMSEEIKYFDYSKQLSKENITIEEIKENIDFFKRFLVENSKYMATYQKFFNKISKYNLEILLGYEYVFYWFRNVYDDKINKMVNLKTLRLKCRSAITDLNFLNSLPNLVNLDLKSKVLDEEEIDISLIGNLKNLRCLILTNYRISNINFFENLNLHIVILESTETPDFDLDFSPLATFKELTTLKILNIGSHNLSLPPLENLKILEIEGMFLDDISFLQKTTNLQNLNLVQNNIRDFSSLQYLNLIKLKINYQQITLINNPIKVKQLILSNSVDEKTSPDINLEKFIGLKNIKFVLTQE